MREILFRGKRKNNGEWVYGNYVNQYGAHEIYLPNGVDSECGLDRYHIIPETVGQFTGLTDKNGRRIFEGDIITTKYRAENVTGVVEYEKYTAAFVLNDGAYLYQLGYDAVCNKSRVKGNIYDNPELIAKCGRKE